MRCHTCGGEMLKLESDLPFKVGQRTIVILKDLPVIQCDNCNEFIIEDNIMERIEQILSVIDLKTELEIIKFAA